MAAAVHANVGQRAKQTDRKVVFKSALDNPFKIPWPHVPLNVQNSVLAALLSLLSGVAEYRHIANRKRKRMRNDRARKERANARKKRKLDDGIEDVIPGPEDMTVEEPSGVADTTNINTCVMNRDEAVSPPPILSHLTTGINDVTRRLESQSQSLGLHTSVHLSNILPVSDTDNPPLTYVFVCRADVNSPLLIAHLPELVAVCNAPSPAKKTIPVHLIPLPNNAEHTLAEAIGIRRVSVLALDLSTPSLATIASLVSSVQPPSAPWLTASITSHIPTHIKQLCTTAPRDMRAAKRERAEGRRASKEKRKTKEKDQRKRKVGKEKKRIKVD